MATLDIQGFAAAAESVALKVDSALLPGLLRRALSVPEGCVAWIKDEDGREEVLRAGETRSGTFAGVLAKTADTAVPVQIEALPNADGHPTTAGVEVVVRVVPRAIELRALLSEVLRERVEANVADLRAYLLPHLRAALGFFVLARPGTALIETDLRAALDAHARESLAPAAFAAGLEVIEARHPSFYCEEYERRRARDAEAAEKARELERQGMLVDLRAQLERNEVLKKREVEELAKVLQYEGVLKDLALKTELDKKRKEEDLRRYEALYEKLGKDDVKALIFLLEDERLKADLIRQLAERDMTEEQLRARRASEVEKKLEARIEELSAKLGAITGAREKKLAEGGTRTRRLLGAYGKTVVAFDPRGEGRRDLPRETYSFEARGLGYLRSVRTAVTREGAVVLAGAQRGVYVVREGDGAAVRELRFRSEPSGQGGVNSTAYFDGHVYATHSELGLSRFDLALGTQEPLFQAVTGRHDSTRGALATADGKLYFASGPHVYRADLLRPTADLVAFQGGEDSLTTFVVTATEVIGGTRGGRILRWSMSDPGAPRELHVRKAEPIYMLKVAEVEGEDHLLVGAKDHGVTAVSLASGRAVDYRAKDQIRWVEGASDFLFGVSRSGYAIHVWDPARLEAEQFELRVPDRLQDVHAQKERAAASAPVSA
jgi:hypothetical protein